MSAEMDLSGAVIDNDGAVSDNEGADNLLDAFKTEGGRLLAIEKKACTYFRKNNKKAKFSMRETAAMIYQIYYAFKAAALAWGAVHEEEDEEARRCIAGMKMMKGAVITRIYLSLSKCDRIEFSEIERNVKFLIRRGLMNIQ